MRLWCSGSTVNFPEKLYRRKAWVRVPLAPLEHDVVRELVQRRSLNLRDCGFESRLRHLEFIWVDWTWESKLSVKQVHAGANPVVGSEV